MPGKLAYLDGKSRFEMDMTEMKSSKNAAASRRANEADGHGQVNRHLPSRQMILHDYPGLEAYVENPAQDPDAATAI